MNCDTSMTFLKTLLLCILYILFLLNQSDCTTASWNFDQVLFIEAETLSVKDLHLTDWQAAWPQFYLNFFFTNSNVCIAALGYIHCSTKVSMSVVKLEARYQALIPFLCKNKQNKGTISSIGVGVRKNSKISKIVHCTVIAIEIHVGCNIITSFKETLQLIFLILDIFKKKTLFKKNVSWFVHVLKVWIFSMQY